MNEPSIFSKIVSREIPAAIIAETDSVIAFHDINPRAELHVLVVPKAETYTNVVELAASDPKLLADIIAVANSVSAGFGNEFRLVFNTGASAGQTVFHVHAHVLAGDLKESSVGSI